MAVVKINDTPIQTAAAGMNAVANAALGTAQLNAAVQLKTKTIDEVAVRTAQQTLEKYMAGKSRLDAKIIDNEDWWKLQHWKGFHKDRLERLELQTSAWLFNSIMNKHADAMDAFPVPAVLPRARDDEETAKTLSSILPVIMDNCKFEQTYSDNWWDKLKNGAAIYAVMWDKDMNGGQGDIAIKAVDMLSFYWEPGVQDIQDSKNIFVIALEDNDTLKAAYPQLEGKLSGNAIDKKQYHYDDTVDTTDKSIVVDWYYKVSTSAGTIVHYVKYVGQEVLFATENEPGYENGLYDHGKYPFVMDVLYSEKGTPAGFGFIDIMKSPQEYIDRLGTAILLNSEEAAKRRYIIKDSAGINEEELSDINRRIIHATGSPNDDNFKALDMSYLSGTYLSVLQDKVNELKETSGNRDFNQGGTASGVTAASAIQALQETGNKGVRDIIKGSYRTYSELCNMIVELIRQFYDIQRVFRITGENGNTGYVSFDNSAMQGGTQMIADEEFKTKAPVFDIAISAQKQSPYSRLSQNELALQFYNAGFFNPQLTDQVLPCIDMMDFEGKEKVRESIKNNGTMYEQLQQMQQLVIMAAQALAEKGDARVLQAVQQMGIGAGTQEAAAGKADMGAVNDAGDNTM